MIAVILVPHRLEVVDDSWEYFLSIRPWFFGGLLVLNVIDLVDTFMKGWEWSAWRRRLPGGGEDAGGVELSRPRRPAVAYARR